MGGSKEWWLVVEELRKKFVLKRERVGGFEEKRVGSLHERDLLE